MTNERSPCCALCARDVYRIGEYAYMVRPDVWKQAIRRGQRHGLAVRARDLLCVTCFERCLGREMNCNDFPADIPLNGRCGADRFRRSRLLTLRMETPT